MTSTIAWSFSSNGIENTPALRCPNCNGMFHRKNGVNGVFWACTGFPSCKMTADVPFPTDPLSMDAPRYDNQATNETVRVKILDQLTGLRAERDRNLHNEAKKVGPKMNDKTNDKTASETPKPKRKRTRKAISNTGSFMKEVLADAATTAIASSVSTAMVDAVRKQIGARWPAALDTPIGRRALELAVPAMIVLACEFFAEEDIPMPAMLLAIEGVAKTRSAWLRPDRGEGGDHRSDAAVRRSRADQRGNGERRAARGVGAIVVVTGEEAQEIVAKIKVAAGHRRKKTAEELASLEKEARALFASTEKAESVQEYLNCFLAEARQELLR